MKLRTPRATFCAPRRCSKAKEASDSDSGIGVPEAEAPKLFREFFRASNAKTSRIPGSGVGLAGAKRLVERFGGEFALQTSENEDSTFTVRLPIHEGA